MPSPVILERALASEGSYKYRSCSLMFLMLTKGKVVMAETLRFAQSDKNGVVLSRLCEGSRKKSVEQ